MGTMASQITSLTIQTQMKENIKAPRHWPLCGNSPGTGEFPAQMVSNAEKVSIWWRHHVIIPHTPFFLTTEQMGEYSWTTLIAMFSEVVGVDL